MVDKCCFVQFPHPGGEHSSGGWNKTHRSHKRKFMQIRGEWIERDGTKRSGDLWTWGEWEPESDLIRKFNMQHGGLHHPRYLWKPYWVPKNSYRGLHNTDPFIFGDCVLYSNCGQVATSKRGLKHLDQGSVIAFGSGKKVDSERKWMLDTVFVIRNFKDYDASSARVAFRGWGSATFQKVTGGPLADNAECRSQGCAASTRAATTLRLYRGATPDDPVAGMFSFFPAIPADGDSGFPRPFISLQDESFNPSNWMAPKGHVRARTLNELRCLWRSLVTQVREAGLVLGTRAEVPPRRDD